MGGCGPRKPAEMETLFLRKRTERSLTSVQGGRPFAPVSSSGAQATPTCEEVLLAGVRFVYL